MVAFVRPEADIFRLVNRGITTAVCNPVSTTGLESGGLFQVFRDIAPESCRQYMRACMNEEVRVGDALVYKDENKPYYVVTLPTRITQYDKPTVDMVATASQALANTIANLNVDIAVPMIGCGKNYEYADLVLPVMMDILDPLSNIVHICVKESYYTTPPIVIGILDHLCPIFDVLDVCTKFGVNLPSLIMTTGTSLIRDQEPCKWCCLPVDENRYGNLDSALSRNYEIIEDVATHLIIGNDVMVHTTKPSMRLQHAL